MPFIELCRSGAADAWFERHYRDRAWARTDDALGNTFHDADRAFSDETIEVYFAPLVSNPVRRVQARGYAIDMLPNPLPAITPQLRTFSRPVRMVWARDLDLFPEALAVWLDGIFPVSRGIRLVDNAKLFFPEEQPDLIVEEARSLWGV
jgi:pimeloyl-ACP methyl ester carboxylesterase